MVNFVIALECFGICLTFVAMILLLHGDGAWEQKLLIFIMCGSLVQNVGYLLELTAPSLEAAVTAVTVENVGSAFVPICYCWFICSYCYEKPPKILLRILAAISFFVLPSVFFNWNGLFYKDIEWLAAPDGFRYVSITYGPLYIIFMLSRILIPFGLCMFILVRAIHLRSDREVNRRYWTILGISSLPVVVMAAYICKLTKVFDFTPLTLAVAMSLVVIVVWSRRNYDFRYLAAEKVLESLGDGVIALDNEDRLISYNRAAAHIFTSLPSHKLGESVRVLEDFRKEMLNENIPWSFSINGQHYESHSKRIRDENGQVQGSVVLILDMTDTKAYINEIKRVRQQAEKANIAKSEFLANMSHEIRTPMNAIIGLNDVIMDECGDSPIYAYAKDVQSAAKNLLAIINDILDLSKVEAGKMELVYADYYLKATMDEVVGMMDMAASKRGLILKYECDDTLPCQYNGDEGRIKQILINILNNAIKFTKEGHVRVSVTGQPDVQEGVELLTCRVEDTGCGIREEDLGKIFENFCQVDSKRNRSVEGTGLGLTIVKHLVEMMGGSIDLQSVYGKGTVVTVTIPQKIVDQRSIAQAPEVSQKEQNAQEEFTAPDIKVLIVDDNPINRKVARGFLKSYAFGIAEAESGPEAIKMVRGERYDIIFMDHMMPMMDGIEAAQIIRSDCGENGTVPVMIALTANAMEGMRERFLAQGFQDFIAKPLDRKALGQLLARWIAKERRHAGSAKEAETSLDPRVFQIKGVDVEEASRYCLGDEAGFAELLELYYIDGQRKIGLLRETAVSDISRYRTEVHGLKSASANIGARDVSNMARAQENAAAEGDTEFIARQLPALLESYEELLGNIAAFLARRKDADAKAEEKLPPLPAFKLKEWITKALHELENFRSREAAAAIESVLCHTMAQDIQEDIQEIKGKLKLYEDDDAEALLRQLLCKLEKEEGSDHGTGKENG